VAAPPPKRGDGVVLQLRVAAARGATAEATAPDPTAEATAPGVPAETTAPGATAEVTALGGQDAGRAPTM
jgi:hypothetical protein